MRSPASMTNVTCADPRSAATSGGALVSWWGGSDRLPCKGGGVVLDRHPDQQWGSGELVSTSRQPLQQAAQAVERDKAIGFHGALQRGHRGPAAVSRVQLERGMRNKSFRGAKQSETPTSRKRSPVGKGPSPMKPGEVGATVARVRTHRFWYM